MMADKEVRLIDASKIEIFLHQMRYVAATHGMDYDVEIISIILETVEHEPTIEAEPVKHGRWEVRRQKDGTTIGQHNVTYCSECGYVLFTKEDSFCARCGARMDGDDNDKPPKGV